MQGTTGGSKHSTAHRGERGIAIPLAVLLLVALGFIATAAVFFSNTDIRLSSSYSTSNNAIAAAEAALEHGLVELTARSRAGQDPDSVQILTGTLGSFSYAVSAYSKREQGAGRDLNGDGDTSDVVRYDRSFGYPRAIPSGAAGDQGYPVKLLIAVATDGRSKAQVQAEVAKDRFNTALSGPLSLNSASNAVLTGNFDVDGRLYTRDGVLVSSSSLNPPYDNTAASKQAAKSQCDYWRAGVKIPLEGALALQGSMDAYGHTSFDHGSSGHDNYDAEDSLSTFKFTPEEVLGVEPGRLDHFKRSASQVPDFSNLSGVNYITSGEVPSQITGSGILIVHNPRYEPRKYDCLNFPASCEVGYSSDPDNQPMTLRINANGSFKGIIITDNLVKLNGNFTMLGGIVSLTTESVNIPANGSGAVKWSCEAVDDALEQAGGYDIRLSWQHGGL